MKWYLLNIALILCCFKHSIALSQDNEPDIFVGKTLSTGYVKTLLGNDVETSNVRFYGDDSAISYFFRAAQIGLPIDSGIILSTGNAYKLFKENNTSNYTSDNKSTYKDDLLQSIADSLAEFTPLNYLPVYNSSRLSFDFIPLAEKMSFRFIFASEEFNEFVDSDYYDLFGFYLSGPGYSDNTNLARVPGTKEPISVKSINKLTNSQYFIDHDVASPDADIEPDPRMTPYFQADGLTTALDIVFDVEPCKKYNLKICIGDVKDSIVDSWVILEGGSFSNYTNLRQDTLICESFDQPLLLDAGHKDKTVIWSTGETTHQIEVDSFGTYWVDITSQCGGTFRDFITIRKTIKDFDIKDTSFCDVIKDFSLEVPFEWDNDYYWSNASLSNKTTIKNSGKHWLTIKKGECTSTDSFEVKIIKSPKIVFSNDTFLCEGDTLHYTLEHTGDNGHWENLSPTTSRDIIKEGVYSFTAFKEKCSSTDSIKIGILKPSDLYFPQSEYKVCGEERVSLEPVLYNSQYYNFIWNTGDTSRNLTINQEGDYTLKVFHKRCDFSDSQSVNVEYFTISNIQDFPNAFSPNGDFLNDTFAPFQFSEGLTDFNLSIYNRWGEKVFETNNPKEGWDGKNVSNSGLYYWIARLKSSCYENKLPKNSGSIHVIK